MILIFIVSTRLGSDSSTSRFLVPFLKWLLGDPSAETINTVRIAIRKGGHLFEYAVMSILCYRALANGILTGQWRLSWAWKAMAISVLYAASDEIHQSFEPTRTGSVVDVMIDSVGALAGLLLLHSLIRWRKRRAQL